MKNPIIARREAQGLNRTQAAIQMGVNYFSLSRLEKGLVASVSELWRPRFDALGWDFETLRSEYANWHTSQAAPGAKAAANG